ncbi:unnamed protein product [Paramecium primaurelia]|uniref:Transmembrane protein n=1 Tax=Paramecium primaurelia TaxID=5886 RepID=A0A8S1MX08_PARPR|nr:unnamed protein product [Paramecium primaurelia]
MFTKILIFPIFISLACFSMNDNLLYVITENETIRLNFSQVFIGNNIIYSTSQTNLKIIQPFNEYNKLELPEQTYPISFKPQLNINNKWMNQFAYLAENFISVNITYSNPQINLNTPEFRTILYIEKLDLTLNCFDFDYFRDDSFIIVCQKETQNLVYIYHKNGELINQIELENFLNVKSIQITNTQEYFYKLETNQFQSVLAIYKWNVNQTILQLESIINNQTIHFLFPQLEFISLKINQYKILNKNIIYVLDQTLGLFKYENNQTTVIKTDKIISFDIDDENGFLIYLQTQKIIVYQYQHYIKTISLDSNIDEKAKVHISGQYVILHNTGYFSSFSIYSGYLLQKINSEGIITYLTSQHYLLTLSNEYSHFYLLNNGYLLLNTDDLETKNPLQFTIQGKDGHGSCNASIILQSIQDNYEILISDYDNKSIIIGSPFHQQELYLRISGPDQNYLCISNCSIQQIINYPFNLQFKDQIIYQDILKINNTYYYLLQQLKNSNQLNINKCEIQSQFVCSLQSIIQIKIDLNEDNFQSQLIDKNLYFVILENSQTISLQTTNSTIKQIVLEKSVKQLLFDNSSLYLIFDNQIHFYQNIIQSNDYILIDESFLNKCSYNIKLQPQKLYINSKRDTLIINNQDSLLITNLFNNFFIKFYLNLEIRETDFIAISDQTFILIKDNILYEYNYYQEVYLIHKLPTYSQQLFQPINAKQINNYLLIQTEQQEIFIYKFNTEAHNSLKIQIQLNIKNLNIQKQKILISPFTQDQHLFVLLYSSELILKKIHLNPIISYQLEYQNNNYIQEMTAVIKVYNRKQSLEIHQSIKQINTFTSIQLLEKELKDKNKLHLQKYQQKIPMVHKWYEGQVIDFIAESEIKDVVTIENLIEKTDDLLLNRLQFNNFISLNNVTKILQGAQSLLLLNSQFQLTSLINLDVQPQYTCISTIQDKVFYYTLCNSLTDSYLHITKIDDGFPLGFLYQFEGFTKKIGSINKKIAFLSGNTLKIGDILFENGQFSIKNIIQINENYLKLKTIFHAIDFDIIQSEGDEYIIQVLDISGIVAVLRGIYKENNYVVFNIKTFDTKELIKKNNYSILSDTSFIFIKNLYYSKSFIQNLSFLILTNNAGSYAIRIIYDDDGNPFLDFMIVQYGFWETQRFDIGNNTISISYKNENKVLIGVYKINFNQQYIEFEQFKIESGLQIDQTQQDPIFFFLKDNYLIVDTQNQIFQEYKINDYIYFIVKGAQDRQHINITAKNDFNSNQLNYIINYHIEEELSNTWWIVLVSVCGGAILIAVFFYLYKRMHPVKSVSSILLE